MSALAKQIELAHRGGLVTRFHCHSLLHKENVGEHSHMVACLVAIYYEFRPSAALLMAALAHDLPEYKLGDVPGPVKKMLPGLSEAYAAAESQVYTDYGWPEFPELTEEEKEVLKFADALSGYLTAFREVRCGNTPMREPLGGYEKLLVGLIDSSKAMDTKRARHMCISAGSTLD